MPARCRPRKRTEQVRWGAPINNNTKDRTLHIYRTALSGHVRRVLYNLPNKSEHEKCCGRRHLSYGMVGVDICHIKRTRWNPTHVSGHQQYCGRQQTVLYPTAWATRLIYEMNLLSLINPSLAYIYGSITLSNHGLIRLNRFVS